MKRILKNSGVLCASLLLSLFLGEGLCRIFLDPADYLSVSLEEDPVLGHKVKSGSRGYDAWGYRNDGLEGPYEVVALGDSQTFGNNATRENSWPNQLQRLLGKKVYNMAVGGYGPPQYYYLLKNKALLLKPSLVIAEFYPGNDLLDSFTMAYQNTHWLFLRDSALVPEAESQTKDPAGEFSEKERGPFASTRYYLSRHSILYRLVVHGPVFGDLLRSLVLRIKGKADRGYTRFKDPQRQIDEGFTPVLRREVENLRDPKVREGLRISLMLYDLMNKICAENGIEFAVLYIPTKERVFADYIEHKPDLANPKAIDELESSERRIVTQTKEFFKRHQIDFIDSLPFLERAAGKEKIYPGNFDGHPTAKGYAKIAESVQLHLMSSR